MNPYFATCDYLIAHVGLISGGLLFVALNGAIAWAFGAVVRRDWRLR